ncbi:MAG: ECF transporter S component [Spirochaetota bacterium]
MQAQMESRTPSSLVFAVLLVLAALIVNVGLSLINTALNLPFFLDSIGTAVVAAVAGLAPALVVAIGTNMLFEVTYGFTLAHLPFAVCGIATVFIVRAFVRTGNFRNVGNVLVASLAVAMANAILGGIVAAFLFGGVTGVGIDFLVTGLVASGQSLLTASFWARVPANIIDKTIAVFVAYFSFAPLRRLGHRLSRDRVRRAH